MACTMRSLKATPVSRASTARTPRASAPLRVVAKAAPVSEASTSEARPQALQIAAATFAAVSMLIAQPVFAAGEVPGSTGSGLTKPDGEVSTKGLGQKVNNFVSKLFPSGAFDAAESVTAQPASTTKAQEIKSVTQMLNEVASPAPDAKLGTDKGSIRAAAKGEADVDPTLKSPVGVSSDPSYNQKAANVPLIDNKA